ncbi:hypothetical protein WG66_003349 [Moniliophthora roreri]|nr:hypothetical protein WG66_003349 [Moniliophthora roreri]
MLGKFFILFTLITIAAVTTSAQPACVLECARESLSAGGCSSISGPFQEVARQCIKQRCNKLIQGLVLNAVAVGVGDMCLRGLVANSFSIRIDAVLPGTG